MKDWNAVENHFKQWKRLPRKLKKRGKRTFVLQRVFGRLEVGEFTTKDWYREMKRVQFKSNTPIFWALQWKPRDNYS